MLKIKQRSFLFLSVCLIIFFTLINACSAIVEVPNINQVEKIIKDGDEFLLVKGVAPVESDVLIYANQQFVGETEVVGIDDQFGSFNFYRSVSLPVGTFYVTAVARDEATQELSVLSNRYIVDHHVIENTPVIKKSEVKPVVVPKEEEETIEKIEVVITPKEKNETKVEGIISEEAAQDENVAVKGYEDEYEENNKVIEEISLENLEEILSGDDNNSSSSLITGLIDEQKEEMSKLKLNVFIFLFFLVMVIIWIFWVNRELIKEKHDNERDDILK